MATVYFSPIGNGQQWFTNSGIPLSGGKINTYAAGSTTPVATYTDNTGTVQNANPIILDSTGRYAQEIWLIVGSAYKFVVTDSNNVTIGTYDNIPSSPGDATLITYTPPGSGAVATTVAAKLGQTPSVLDYGADPTGAADSAPAFTNFFTALGTNRGLVPCAAGSTTATYKLNSNPTFPVGARITVQGGVKFSGAGSLAGVDIFQENQNPTSAVVNATTTSTSTVMTINSVTSGVVTVGQSLGGAFVTANTTISSFGTFNGTSGTINLSLAATTGGTGLVTCMPSTTPVIIDLIDEKNSYGVLRSQWSYPIYIYRGISVSIDGNTPGTSLAPQCGAYDLVTNGGGGNGPGIGNVVARLCHVNSGANSSSNYAGNDIAQSSAGQTGVQLVGREIDIQPGSGTTPTTTSAGLIINLLSSGATSSNGPAQIIGGVGGSFKTGIVVNALGSTGAGLVAGSGLTCQNLIDTSQIGSGSFSDSMFRIKNTHNLRFLRTDLNQCADVVADVSNNLYVTLGASATMMVNCNSSTEGTSILSTRSSGASASVTAYVATGTAGNAANAALKVNANSVTSRSINSGGTNNASGLDYAEYEVKRDDCGVISKGQIVGFDADGLLTDKWNLAVSFGIKSTSPSFVGGDVWHLPVGPEPVRPDGLTAPNMEPPQKTITVHYYRYKQFIDAEHDKAMAQWQADHDEYQAKLPGHIAAMAKYESDLSVWQAAHEAERIKVDRVAYCGKVPVNVRGAKPGDYIVPAQDGDGIIGTSISKPNFEQYESAVGRVRCILPDGRAEVVVKPI